MVGVLSGDGGGCALVSGENGSALGERNGGMVLVAGRGEAIGGSIAAAGAILSSGG